MPRTAYLIPGRGGKWGGWRRDVRRRFRRFRFRRFRFRRLRSPGWVAAGGRATHPVGTIVLYRISYPSISNQIGTNRIPMIKSIILKGQNHV